MSRTETTLETEALWREFHQRLRAFISRRTPRSADVEDILQEVFIRIHRGVGSLHDRERPAPWLFQITRNAIIDHLRAGRSQAGSQPDDFDPPAPDGDDGPEILELSRCIEPMIAALPEDYREAIQLTDINGLTQIEAAKRNGLTFSGMKSRVQRARRQLKDMLLDCCRVELDRRGGIRDYSVRDVSKSPCGPVVGRSDLRFLVCTRAVWHPGATLSWASRAKARKGPCWLSSSTHRRLAHRGSSNCSISWTPWTDRFAGGLSRLRRESLLQLNSGHPLNP